MRLFGFEITVQRVPSWKYFAKRGDRLNAVRQLRTIASQTHPNPDDPKRMTLRQALDTVNAYMKKKGIKV